jgi:sterol desaturase/sphingolipid hydroxylase (fatty acid hydroxylase superfamily)
MSELLKYSINKTHRPLVTFSRITSNQITSIMRSYGPTTFALFRIILGIYLVTHFTQLIPVATELFSNKGVIDNAKILPTYGKLPVFLMNHDDPLLVDLFIGSLILSSVLFTIGVFRRINSLWIFYGWMSLLNRNPLISNPSLGYIGWILLACSTIPKGERLGFILSEKKRKEEKTRWEMPDSIYYGMWIIIGVSYTASGLHKLQCPDWVNGTALRYVLDGHLARQNNPIVDLLLSSDFLIKTMTLGSLFIEISFLFLGTFYHTRKYYWIMIMGFHFGILFTVNFSDLTLGMIMAHLFTFDPAWFSFTRKFFDKYDKLNKTNKNNKGNHNDNGNNNGNGNNNDNGNNHVDDDHSEKTCSDSINELSRQSKQSIEKLVEKSSESESFNTLSWITYTIVIILAAILINSKNGLNQSINRITEITVNMYWGFGFLVLALMVMMVLERLFPDQELKPVRGWWLWVMIINFFQLVAVILASFTWENWLQNTSYYTSSTGFHLRDYVSPFVGGLLAYLINQWLFYHWHKARHEVYFLWILFHQFHHSASRIETITSFYKHPLEIIIDSQIMAILLYSVLGLTNESSIWLSIFSGVGEYIYHMNIKTPQIIGYFFQRPESHRIHHRHMRRRDCPNYSDFPLWDILGGTFENPSTMNDPSGFTPDREVRRFDMLFFKDVMTNVYQDVFSDFRKFKKVFIRYIWYALVIWGTLNASAFITHFDGMREIGFATVSSPLPLVFSTYNGYETFATNFSISVVYQNGTEYMTDLDVHKYNRLKGAYNKRNVYGAMFSHGPFFDKHNMIVIRDKVLEYAVCSPGQIIKDFGIDGNISSVHVDIFYRPESNKKIGSLDVICTKENQENQKNQENQEN